MSKQILRINLPLIKKNNENGITILIIDRGIIL